MWILAYILLLTASFLLESQVRFCTLQFTYYYNPWYKSLLPKHIYRLCDDNINVLTTHTDKVTLIVQWSIVSTQSILTCIAGLQVCNSMHFTEVTCWNVAQRGRKNKLHMSDIQVSARTNPSQSLPSGYTEWVSGGSRDLQRLWREEPDILVLVEPLS